jgi:hypothetical protein
MLAVLLLALAAPPAPRVEERRLDLVLVWNEQALDAIRAEKTPPPVAARQLAMLHAAIFDTINVIKPTHKPLLVTLRAREEMDVNAAVAACAAHLLSQFYPKRATRFEKLRDAQAAGTGDAIKRGLALGQYSAKRYLYWRRYDRDVMKGTYRAPAAVGIWRPTPPKRAAALYPDWGKMEPFAIKSHALLKVPDPPDLTSSDYALDVNEVKSLGARNSLKRSPDQTIIAKFWDDGAGTCTPPGHWNLIAQEASLRQKLSIQENARLFALLNLALADAGVACWRCKYKNRLWRPITAIHEADRDANAATEKDDTWAPLLETPPFPSYVSGHSTFSGAGAAALAGFFGRDDVPFEIRSDGYPGTLRKYKGFQHAANEAGRSRIYGGIHYECDNREGLALGKAVGLEVVRTRLVPLPLDR